MIKKLLIKIFYGCGLVFVFNLYISDTIIYDYNNNTKIELKKIEDSFASAANYIKKIGWKKNEPCFFKIDLKDKIPGKFLNTSARKIKNKKKIVYFKKYLKNPEKFKAYYNMKVGIITPDKDIIPGSKTLQPHTLWC